MEDCGVITILFWGLLQAVIAWQMAKARGRNETAGFAAGFFFGIFAWLYYAVVGDSEEKKAAERAKLEESLLAKLREEGK